MRVFLNDKINSRNEFSATEIVKIHVFTKIKQELILERFVTFTLISYQFPVKSQNSSAKQKMIFQAMKRRKGVGQFTSN